MLNTNLWLQLPVCLTLSLFALPTRAQPQTSSSDAQSGWQAIQPMPDLRGWTRVPIPPTAQLGRAQWHVEPASKVLVCDGDGGHEMLRFDRELTNGTFHAEFRFPPVTEGKTNYNSGVFIRTSANGDIWHQAQLTMDGGYLFGVSPTSEKPKRFKLSPLERRMKPAGEWNTIEVTAQDKSIVVSLNGARTSSFDECGQPKGYIAVESEGYKIEFRNLRLKELK
jgi:hypothetical protein